MTATFDEFAGDYSSALRSGLDLTGEAPDFYARGRVQRICQRVSGLSVNSILDFGCGTGGSLRELATHFPGSRLVGVDPSEESLVQARTKGGDHPVQLVTTLDEVSEPVDLIFCNGVFHHIEPEERHDILVKLRSVMTPGARFAFWENNPWNPGTRLVMSRIPFDRDARTISVPAARRLLCSAGFRVELIDNCFWFPRSLALLRPMESFLRKVPLAGQYMCLCSN